jgi:hypothetical protein
MLDQSKYSQHVAKQFLRSSITSTVEVVKFSPLAYLSFIRRGETISHGKSLNQFGESSNCPVCQHQTPKSCSYKPLQLRYKQLLKFGIQPENSKKRKKPHQQH